MANQLFADEFDRSDQPALATLDCGDEPWSRAATEWITGSEVLDSIEKYQTSVWIYRDADDSIVGFGALAATGWQRWPPPDGKRSRLLYIPQLGIDFRFRGFPPDKSQRYSHQIISHLIYQARVRARAIRTEKPPSKHVDLLTLRVHRQNLAAQRLYQRFGFQWLDGFEDHEHLAMFHRLDLE